MELPKRLCSFYYSHFYLYSLQLLMQPDIFYYGSSHANKHQDYDWLCSWAIREITYNTFGHISVIKKSNNDILEIYKYNYWFIGWCTLRYFLFFVNYMSYVNRHFVIDFIFSGSMLMEIFLKTPTHRVG